MTNRLPQTKRAWIALFVVTVVLELLLLTCALFLFDIFAHTFACHSADDVWDPIARECHKSEPRPVR